ncbi:unnamed protein product [Parascedosporium putredinis]|uniref:DUF3669 domain-containing protein n=1 Tax=Parascedosporium putredinis TaxID=1442378 RepID=A0A9P1H1S8_9PEZI|nr:unnamed protein product [Parascedosporium putredinis]CAI7993361.1 unnamed protein product [Parascedosporium putredinis]
MSTTVPPEPVSHPQDLRGPPSPPSAASSQSQPGPQPASNDVPPPPKDETEEATQVATEAKKRMNRELKRMLTITTEISTASSEAQRNASAQGQTDTPCRQIGAGACGTVWSSDGRNFALKIGRFDNADLRNDFDKHVLIARAFAEFCVASTRVPHCYDYRAGDDARKLLESQGIVDTAILPAGEDGPPTGAILCAERIWPLPEATRHLLVDRYCHFDPAQKEQAKGTRPTPTASSASQMKELELDVASYARGMAEAMAVMHWAAQTDARDVEFVLGSAATMTFARAGSQQGAGAGAAAGSHGTGLVSFLRRSTELWLLDFNQVRSITLDQDGVAMAIDSAMVNDPYIPRPTEEGAKEV